MSSLTDRLAPLLLGLAAAACSMDPPTTPPPSWVDPGTPDQFLGYDLMPELEIQIAAADITKLDAHPDVYVPATLIYQGGSYGPVGLKLKGQNSFLPFSQKASLRINVNEYDPAASFWGLKDLTLNNMSSDPSMMHERLAYKVARDAGLTASRANHLLLSVNGQFYGLYANVETVKHRMIKDHFDDGGGSLFEATDVDFQPQFIGAYKLKDGPDDRTRIAGLVQALAMPDTEQALAAASEFVDLHHFQRYWAMETIIGQFDAFPYSVPGDDYYLYDDPTSGKLWFIPWGMDETFISGQFPPMQINSQLAVRCLGSATCKQAYVDQVWELLAMTEAMGLEGERARVQAQIAPYIARDTRKPYDMAAVTEGQTQLGYFIRGRRELLGMMLPPPSP